eukprot:GDKH01021516.1.p2 GENE.GDKH01021516.1~~GDKH01021516.1.p2  ORF type:complete len:64 (-),score=7.91 GDKH01021516.1:86-277(-)
MPTAIATLPSNVNLFGCGPDAGHVTLDLVAVESTGNHLLPRDIPPLERFEASCVIVAATAPAR